jgi:hypothetical protein
MLPDVERGGAPGVTKFENGSRIDAEPRSAVLTFPRARSPQPALVSSTPGAKRGRPRVHLSPAVRQQARRLLSRYIQNGGRTETPHGVSGTVNAA